MHFYSSIATLGDPPINNLTSSFYVAEKRKLSHKIIGFESFEDAVEAVRTGKVEAALVAGAYPRIRDFIMDTSLICVDTFVEQIPPLVLVGLQSSDITYADTVYLHPATLPLLTEFKMQYSKIIETQSTSAAAAKAKQDSQSIAICNKLAADYYGLTIHQVLHPSVNMPFAVFKVVG